MKKSFLKVVFTSLFLFLMLFTITSTIQAEAIALYINGNGNYNGYEDDYNDCNDNSSSSSTGGAGTRSTVANPPTIDFEGGATLNPNQPLVCVANDQNRFNEGFDLNSEKNGKRAGEMFVNGEKVDSSLLIQNVSHTPGVNMDITFSPVGDGFLPAPFVAGNNEVMCFARNKNNKETTEFFSVYVEDDDLEVVSVEAIADSAGENEKCTELIDIEGHPFQNAIQIAFDAGKIHGNPDCTFRPDNFINRAETAKVISTYSDMPEDWELNNDLAVFSDIDYEAWYGIYVAYTTYLDIFRGHEDGTFQPGGLLTRAEAIALILRMFELENFVLPEDFMGPEYVTEVYDHWAYDDIMIAYLLGLLDGVRENDGLTSPFGADNPITRGEFVDIAQRAQAYVLSNQ